MTKSKENRSRNRIEEVVVQDGNEENAKCNKDDEENAGNKNIKKDDRIDILIIDETKNKYCIVMAK